MIRPTGTSRKARYWQAVYDELMARRAMPSLGFLTSRTTRGVHRRPVIPIMRRGEDLGEFTAMWVFRSPGEGTFGEVGYSTDVPIVGGGIAFASSVQERTFLALGQTENAIAASDTGEGNSFLMVQSKLFNPRSRIRIQLTCNPLAVNGDFFGTPVVPCLYFRLIEIPFPQGRRLLSGTTQAHLDSTKGFAPVTATYQPAQSSSGHHVYSFGAAENALIIPDSRVLAIVEGNTFTVGAHLLKPRPDWGGVWIEYGNALGGSLILSEPTDDQFVYAPYYRLWSIPSSPAGDLARNRFPTTTVMPGSEIAWHAAMDGITDGFEITIDSQPADGDSIRYALSNRQYLGSSELFTATWRNTVSDPLTEIQIGASLSASLENFETFQIGTPGFSRFFPTCVRTGNAKWLTINRGAVAVYGWVSHGIPTSTANVRYTPVITGNFGTITRVLTLGAENSWAPSPNAFNKPTASGGNSDSCFRSDWMAIPLTANFDQTVDIPAFSNPFFVQAFFGRFLDIHPDRSIPRFDINLTVTPA